MLLFSFYLILGFASVFGGVFLIGTLHEWLQDYLDRRLFVTDKDYEHSEFGRRRWLEAVIASSGAGLALAGIYMIYSQLTRVFTNLDMILIAGIMVAFGTAVFMFGLAHIHDRVVIKNWRLYYLRQGRPLWVAPLPQVESITREYLGLWESHLSIRLPGVRRVCRLPHRGFRGARKLRVMLSGVDGDGRVYRLPKEHHL